MKTLTRLAAAAVVALAIGGSVLWMIGWGSSVAFADVLKQVRELRSVSFKMTGSVDVPGQPAQKISADVTIVEPARMRQTQTTAAGEMIMIWDLQRGRSLTLMPATKQAFVLEMLNREPGKVPSNLLDDFRKMDEKAASGVGEKEIAGHRTKGFKVVTPGMDMTIWADEKTRLPVEIEQTMKVGIVPTTTMTMSDFAWDAKVDESLLSLTPPPGYTLQTLNMDMSPAAEKDLINALKAAAELNEGKFLDRFDVAGLAAAMARANVRIKPGSPEHKTLQERGPQAMLTVGRGWMFIGEAKNGDDWNYAGKDVPLGKAGTPIFWYRPAGSTTYRVIDADLSVHDVQPDQLPQVPSIKVGPPGPAIQPEK